MGEPDKRWDIYTDGSATNEASGWGIAVVATTNHGRCFAGTAGGPVCQQHASGPPNGGERTPHTNDIA